MLFGPDDRIIAAETLRIAASSGRPAANLAATFAGMGTDGAYAIQELNVAARRAAGASVTGRKVGLTSKVMQDMFGVDEPDFGYLLDDMAVADGGEVAVARFLQPRVEVEVAFVVGRRLVGDDVTPADVVDATDHVVAAIEIIDSRFDGWNITFLDTVADNASSGAYVLGGTSVPLSEVDVAALDGRLVVNRVVVDTGSSSAVMGNPVEAVAWLARTLSRFDQALEPGQVVLSGSCTAAHPVIAGDLVEADFDRLGTVAVRFA